jgi:hypothetical protein
VALILISVLAGTYKKERKEFARDSLAFARESPSIYEQVGRSSTDVPSDASE